MLALHDSDFQNGSHVISVPTQSVSGLTVIVLTSEHNYLVCFIPEKWATLVLV